MEAIICMTFQQGSNYFRCILSLGIKKNYENNVAPGKTSYKLWLDFHKFFLKHCVCPIMYTNLYLDFPVSLEEEMLV
jgi:hypothetical protein